jgi:hypothetical protein
MPCKPIGEDTAYYQQKAVERSTLAEKRIRVAKVAAEAAHKDLLKTTLPLPAINWDRSFDSGQPIRAPVPRQAPARIDDVSSVVIEEVPDLEKLTKITTDKLILESRLEEQLSHQRDITVWRAKQLQAGCAQSAHTADRAFGIYQKEIDRLNVLIHNADLTIKAMADAFPDDGARADSLEHAQLTALDVDVPTNFSSMFVQEFYAAPLVEVEVSEFAQSAYGSALKVLEPDVTDAFSSASKDRSSIGQLRADPMAPIITDADSASEVTEQ